MKTSAIVAFRDQGDGHRQRLWDFVRLRLEAEHPEVEVVVEAGPDGDPFWKTAALNAAAARAHGDVLLLTDADTWTPPSSIDAAIAGAARDRESWWRPYRRKVKLLEIPTQAALEGGIEWVWSFDPRAKYERQTTFPQAPPLVLSHQLWDAVGGQDERFRGWGSEDSAFGFALEAVAGPQREISGDTVHLWHPRIGWSGNDLWPGQTSDLDNKRLAEQYRRARRSRDAMLRLIGSR